MCTQIKTSEFFPAVLYCETNKEEGEAPLSIKEKDLWSLAKKVEKKCWSNVNLNRKDLRDLIPFMDYVYGPDFIQWDESQEKFTVKNLDKKIQDSLAGYFFSKNTAWYRQLENIITPSATTSAHSDRLVEELA
ncbi:MAG: hypothetical protein J6X88_07730 [Bacteroidales bacterium]|nr:hypothetical protein [Bacteroidales bacterium]